VVVLLLCSRFTESAKVYAETQMSFEEIALKFVDLEDKDPLKQFLLNKINTLKSQVSHSLPEYINELEIQLNRHLPNFMMLLFPLLISSGLWKLQNSSN
jgi:hypothetical protein